MSKAKPLRIAATSDIHYTKTSKGALKDLFAEASSTADVLLVCGDFTDYGLPEEATVLAEDLKAHVRIPIIGVEGNHDFESGKNGEVRAIIEQAGVTFLDGETAEIGGVGFAGVCGFGGGFGQQMLNAWGEPLIKAFVQEALEPLASPGKGPYPLDHGKASCPAALLPDPRYRCRRESRAIPVPGVKPVRSHH